MGIVQKDALRTMVITYAGLVLGYVNKAVLMIIFLDPEEIGLVNLLLGVGLLFGQATNLGSIFATWKFFPFFENKEKHNHGFLGLMITVTLIGIVLFTALFFLFQNEIASFYQENSPQFNKFAIWIIPVGIAYVFYSLFEAYLRGMYINIISVFSYELLLRLLISVIILGYGLGWYSFQNFVAIHCLVYFIPPVILIGYLLKIKEFKVKPKYWNISKRFRKIILGFSLYSYVNTLGALAVVTIDAMMVSSMLGLKETGIYTIIVYLTSALMVPYRSIARVTIPLISLHWKEKNMAAMEKLYKQVSSVSLFIALTLFSLIWINRNEFFSVLPDVYQPGIWLFFILMMGKLVDLFFGINGSILNTSKKYRVDLIFTCILLIGVYALNLLLIPIYGIYGAAISTSIVVVIYNIARLGYVYYAFRLEPFESSQWKVLALFIGFLIGAEFLPGPNNFSFWTIGLKTTLLVLCTAVPIYFFNIEVNSADYMRKVFVKLKLVKEK